MPKKSNLVDREFERLTVIRETTDRLSGGGGVVWECECDCGTICYATSGQLNSGHKRSCGCLKLDNLSGRTGENHPNWKGGHWNRGSLAQATCMLAALRQHARKGNYEPPRITPEELSSLINNHSGSCSICGSTEEQVGTFCLDHNHQTGQVRGLICRRCNHLLGCAGDDQKVLQAAVTYLGLPYESSYHP